MSENKMATKADLMEFYSRIYPYLGVMPIGLANKFSKDSLYSTDEKIVGCWIDGKPLYQKSFLIDDFSNPTHTGSFGSQYDITHNLPIDNCIDCFGIIKMSYDSGTSYIFRKISGFTLNAYATSESEVLHAATANGCSVTISSTGFEIGIGQRSLYGLAILLTVHYTKTTDAVNSFKYGDATDYSTMEKIVGTWIDGKPLYQKTFLNIPMVADSVNQGVFKGILVSAQDGANLNLVGYEKLIEHDSRYTPPTNSLFTVGLTGTRNYSQQEVFYSTSVSQDSDKSIFIHERRNDAQDITSWEIFDVTIQYTKTTD